MRYFVTLGGRVVEVELAPDGVRVDGTPCAADLETVPGTSVRSLLLDGASHRVVARSRGRGRWDLQVRGRHFTIDVIDERTRVIRQMISAGGPPPGPKPVRAPMPGLVVRVDVQVGDRVRPGQGLVIVEAMKMENELRAEASGRVTGVRVSPGEAVERDQVLIDLGPEDEPSGKGDA
jgi:acetyl/propionyl-CoA carboxylase alpha subunit